MAIFFAIDMGFFRHVIELGRYFRMPWQEAIDLIHREGKDGVIEKAKIVGQNVKSVKHRFSSFASWLFAIEDIFAHIQIEA